MSVPIILVHQGFQPCLEVSLGRAAACNPRSRLVLLGDDSNAHVRHAEHVSCADPSLQADLAAFHAAYRHLATSRGDAFERLCIARWLLVRNFMRREGLDACLVIDSDVLLFCDATAEARRFRHCSMTFGRWDAVRLVPHCNFIGRRDALESFCEHVLRVYHEPALLNEIAVRNMKRFQRTWVSDMSLFHDWAEGGAFPVGLLEDTLHDGVGYDICIDTPGGFEPVNFLPGVLRPWKRITYRDGLPYARTLDGRDIPMKCLHFHGRFKPLMERHAAGQPDDWRAAAIMLGTKWQALPKRLRLFSRNYLRPRAPMVEVSRARPAAPSDPGRPAAA